MKPAHIRVAIVVMSLVVVPAAWAQEPKTVNQAESSSAASVSTATVPMLIEFGGTLLDRDNRPMVGPVGVTFALYAEQTGGAALWMETQNVHLDANGNYAVFLGAASRGGLPAEQFASGKARWLGIQVENKGEQPRIMLVSVPYALKAGDAATLGGLPPSAFLTKLPQGAASSNAPSPGRTVDTADASANRVHTSANSVRVPAAPAMPCPILSGGGNTDFFARWTGHCTLGSSALFETCTTSGCNVGIGTQTPQAGMDVESPATSTLGVLAVTSNSSFFAAGVFGHATATGGVTRGVYGVSESPFGIGVHGIGVTGGQFESGSGLILKGRGFGSDQFTLDAAGNMRLNGGFSSGGSGLFQIDAPNVSGGRFTILPNGNVGINKASPTTTLDVAGAASVSGAVAVGGALKIGGDVPMSSNPRMFFNGFLPGAISVGQLGASIIPGRDITVTRVSLVEGVVPANCTNFGTISVGSINVPLASFVNPDSGPLSVNFAAGNSIFIQVSDGESGCNVFHTTAGNVWVSVEYRMQ